MLDAAIPYDPGKWLLVSRTVSRERLADVAELVFEADRAAINRYADPNQMNELFTWARLEVSWPLEGLVYRHGIGRRRASTPHSLVYTGRKFGKSQPAMSEAYTRALLGLRYAQIHHRIAPRGHGINELRALGLPSRIWFQLAQARVLTLDDLCGLREGDLYNIRRLGQNAVELIKALLHAQGRSLRS